MLLDHAGRHSLGLWRAWARAFNAVVMIRLGNIGDGLRLLRQELANAGQATMLPRYLFLIGELAAGLCCAGELTLGFQTVDDAIARCKTSNAGWYVPELLRVRGELLMRQAGPDTANEAEEHFQQALGWRTSSGSAVVGTPCSHQPRAPARHPWPQRGGARAAFPLCLGGSPRDLEPETCKRQIGILPRIA